MKKITNFIVDKRKIILIIFIILAIVCAIVSQKVEINDDITKYLPSDSETRIGMDKMEEEFDQPEKSSSFNIMFKGLTEEDKEQIYNELSNQENVFSVDYDKTEEYNKEDYTLYTINVDEPSDSKISKDVYENIIEQYKKYDIETNGDIADSNLEILPTWILVVAITGVAIILIIMCESYVEPFLFLFSILIAILLNNGTNIIFNNVSNITSSISAILQLALSMDYSIMLINRFRQENEIEPDKVKAMKQALLHSIQSISSSSVTTIVGLICLVFMSFTIGKDLGFVLAKGVLLSLVSVFCVLPGLILLFDKLINKTKKKSPSIKLDGLGKFSNKFRYPLTFLFFIIFVTSFLLKGNLNIAYTNSDDDEVAKIFGKNNQIAVIYKSEDEEKIAKHLKELEENEKVDEVLGYSNTINEELYYDELVQKLNDLGNDTEIEDYLLKIIYYKYYNPDENNTLTFDEMVNFIQTEIYENSEFNDELTESLKKDIERLSNFTNSSKINKKRSSKDIASILEMEESDVNDILTYYNSKNNNLKLSLPDFVDFMNNTVLKDNKYSSNIDAKTREDLNKLTKFTNKTTINKKYTSSQMANLFEMSETNMKDLYIYYISVNEINTKLTLSEFANFVLTDVITNDTYAKMFDDNTINSIKLLATYSDTNTINKQMTSKELGALLGIDETKVTQLLLLKYMNENSENKYTIPQIVNNSIALKQNTNYLDNVDISAFEQLSVFTKNENNINTTKMDKAHLSAIFNNISDGLVNNIYLIAGLPDSYLLTPQEFVNLVISQIPTQTSESIDVPAFNMSEKSINQLKLLKLVIDETVSNSPTKYSNSEAATILGVEKSKITNLFALFDFSNGKTSHWKSTPYEFVNLIINNSENTQIKNSITNNQMQNLKRLNNIMNSSLNNTKYSYSELSSFINSEADKTKNIYGLYESKKVTITLTPQEFVKFVLEHKNDSILKSNLTSNTTSTLELLQAVMNSTINNTKYSSQSMSSLLGIDKSRLDLIYGLYVSKTQEQTISLNVLVDFLTNDVMNNEDYSASFDNESKTKLQTVKSIMKASLNETKYTKDEMIGILKELSNELEDDTLELVYLYYGSDKEYNSNWKLTIEQFVNFLNEDILKDERFTDFIDDTRRNDILDSKETIDDAKELLVGDKYSRIVINTSFESENEETFEYIQKVKDILEQEDIEFYVIGDSPMAYEMSKTFGDEFNFISILTMIAIFIVVALTFKSITIPIALVGVIQCAVYLTMGILSISGGSVYFIALLIVQSILMGSTIDYAILYTSYYLEYRNNYDRKESIIKAYNESIHTILTSGTILVDVTFIVGMFAKAITAKICITLCKGTLCSMILILFLLPAILGIMDKWVVKKKKI